MSNSKVYKEYKIDKEEYLELVHFCRQYHTKKEKVRSCYALKAVSYDGIGGGSSISKPTEQQAILAENLNRDCELIERAAVITDSSVAEYIIKNVTNKDMPYEYLGSVPMGRQQFYAIRRKFFFILNTIRKMG